MGISANDKKGIRAFLLITFVMTYGIHFFMYIVGISPILQGFGQYAVAAVMWVPAVAALITIKWVTREPLNSLNIRFADWRPYLFTLFIIPACFLAIYLLTYFLGLGKPDWNMSLLNNLYTKQGLQAPEISDVKTVWIFLYLATFLLAPIINSVFGFGEELGWRGYLLPKLMPLGKWKAYSLLAIIWAAWHFPMVWVGFMYPGFPLAGMLFFILLTFSLGIYMNELTLKFQSSLLPGFIHGVFNSQRLGVWTLLFPQVNPVLGGFSGITGIVVWAILGISVMYGLNSKHKLFF